MLITDANYQSSASHSAKYRNLGLDLLRILMCFEVILCHFWDNTHSATGIGSLFFGFFSRSKAMAVPTFMMLSFMLNGRYLLNWRSNPDKLIKRISRIVRPIVFWAIVYFVVYKYFLISGSIDFEMSWESLFWQILTGHAYNTPMWFMNDLLFFTVFIAAVSLVPGKNAKTISFAFLIAASFVIQILGLHGLWFGDMMWELKYPLGRLFELLPYIAFAMLLFSAKITDKLARYRKAVILCGGSIYALLLIFQPYLPDAHTYSFDYSGWKLFVLTITLTLTFMLLPLDCIRGKLRMAIEHIAKYTLGIYCIHCLIGTILNNHMEESGLPQYSFSGCIIIFVAGYAVCRILASLPWRWCRQVVQ